MSNPVIVTGGASGLGRAVADAVRSSGRTAVVFDLRPPDADLAFERVDVSDRRTVQQAMTRVAEQHDGIGAVVACAGIDACGRFAEVDADAWERVIAVNLIGTASVIRAALPHLERSRGRVVAVASTLGLRPVSDATAYCASKFGVVGFTRALAAELAGRVGVTLLVPGGMDTHFFDGRTEQYRPPADLRLNRPEDVARAVLFALDQPAGCEVRELVVCPATETSWP